MLLLGFKRGTAEGQGQAVFCAEVYRWGQAGGWQRAGILSVLFLNHMPWMCIGRTLSGGGGGAFKMGFFKIVIIVLIYSLSVYIGNE